MSQTIPDRPELLATEFWTVDRLGNLTTAYIDVDGASPEITNHLSAVTYKIIEGAGRIASTGLITDFEVETAQPPIKVTVPRAQQYFYEGHFSALVNYRVPPYAAYVTFDGQPLGKNERKILRRAEREMAYEKLLKKVVGKIGLAEFAFANMEQIVAMGVRADRDAA